MDQLKQPEYGALAPDEERTLLTAVTDVFVANAA
jgi:hypothetical protein